MPGSTTGAHAQSHLWRGEKLGRPQFTAHGHIETLLVFEKAPGEARFKKVFFVRLFVQESCLHSSKPRMLLSFTADRTAATFLTQDVTVPVLLQKSSQKLHNWSPVSPPYKLPYSLSLSLLPPSTTHPPSRSAIQQWEIGRVVRKVVLVVKPASWEVFKMTFPQLMPDTFSRGREGGKCKWACARWEWAAGCLCGPVGLGLDSNQGHPATAIRASHRSVLACEHTLCSGTLATSMDDFNVRAMNLDQSCFICMWAFIWYQCLCWSSVWKDVQERKSRNV